MGREYTVVYQNYGGDVNYEYVDADTYEEAILITKQKHSGDNILILIVFIGFCKRVY